MTAASAAPSTSPSTPPTRPVPRSACRWLASRQRTQTPGSAHSSPTPEDPAAQASSSSATTESSTTRSTDASTSSPGIPAASAALLHCNAAQDSPTPSSPPTSPLATRPDELLSKSHSPPTSKPAWTGDASLLAHIGTDAAVADLEAIRQALGGDPITYVGFSYGTLIGLRYAEQYPDALRAMVLDGVVRPDANLGDRLVAAAASLDRSLAEVLNACGPDCPIDGDPVQAYRDLAEAVRTEPLQLRRRRESGSTPSGWPASPSPTTRNIAHRSTKPSPKASTATECSSRCSPKSSSQDFELGPNFAVDCIDVPHPTTSAEVEALASQAADAATVLPELSGAYVRVFALPCLSWPVPAPTDLEPITAAGAPPILVVGNTGDPVTPFESAEHVAANLADGHLLTYLGSGHATYRKDSCADASIDSYLLDLTRPCRIDRLWMTFGRRDVRRDVRSNRGRRRPSRTPSRQPRVMERDGRR